MEYEKFIQFLTDAIPLYGTKFLVGVLLLIVGLVVIKIIKKGIVKAFERTKLDITIGKFLTNVIHVILVTALVIATLDMVGIQTASFIAIFGAAGLAIGLALQGSLSNLAAGVMIVIFRPFRAGQFVEAGGTMGTVSEIQIFNTILTTPDNKLIIVPNSKIIGDTITNFTANDTRRMDLVFGIGYGDDIKKAKDIIKKVMDSDSRILKEPAVTIGVLELADSSVNLAVRPWVKTSEYWGVYWDVMEKMKEEFDANGISIPFPQRDIHMYQATGN